MTPDITGAEMFKHQERVRDLNKAKGWYDEPVPFLQAMLLLVSELDETEGAWAADGLKDGLTAKQPMASEIADVYIRLLDDCSRYHVDLATAVDIYRFPPKKFNRDNIHACLWEVVRPIIKTSEAYRVHGLDYEDKAGPEIAKGLAETYHYLEILCRLYGVELTKTFDLKMTVNWTRPYRHGGKHA